MISYVSRSLISNHLKGCELERPEPFYPLKSSFTFTDVPSGWWSDVSYVQIAISSNVYSHATPQERNHQLTVNYDVTRRQQGDFVVDELSFLH